MQPTSAFEDIVNTVRPFRLLLVGRSGVGKSTLANLTFGWDGRLLPIENWTPGIVDIERGYASPQNPNVVFHDSQGFEPGDNGTFGIVSGFIRRRREESLPLKDQLHAIWLCTETPRAGGRIFEAGDENLIQLAHQTQTPIVVVFTKYDKLVRTLKEELREDNPDLAREYLENLSKEGARERLAEYMQLLSHTLSAMRTPLPPIVNVSDRPGYEATIKSLLEVTYGLVRDKLKGQPWEVWADDERASPPSPPSIPSIPIPPSIPSIPAKIDECVDNALSGIASGIGLHRCLAKVHQNIVTCWNVREKEKALSSNVFKQSMLCLVQDIQEPHKWDGPHTTANTASVSPIAAFGLTVSFKQWLSNAVLNHEPPPQRVFIAYTADLITVLKSLFENGTPSISSGTPRTTWPALNRAYQAYKLSDTRRQTYRRICADFQQDRQIYNQDSFRHLLRRLLLRCEPVPLPN